MQSKITGGPTEKLFEERVLNKYTVSYYRCLETGFVQTEEPYWLQEAYSAAITQLDLGLLHRNLELRDQISRLLARHFNKEGKYLDYGGGYGVFTRLMRDRGFNFFHQDPMCDNLFARFFDAAKLPADTHFEMVTAIEVAEHLTQPVAELGALLQYADSILFTTELQPTDTTALRNWWYMAYEHGQHIALYTTASLHYMARQWNCNYYTNGQSIHLITKRSFDTNPLKALQAPFLLRKLKKLCTKMEQRAYGFPEGKLEADWRLVLQSLQQS